MRSLGAAFLIIVGATQVAVGQAGILGGWVTSDSAAKKMIAAADVSIPALGLTTRSNQFGEYRFDGLRAGRYLVIASAAGFRSVGDSATVAATGQSVHDFVLFSRAVVLDSVVTTATSPARTYISPALRGAEERSKQGFGHFIKEDELRKHDHDRLSSVLTQKVPGVTLSRGPNGTVFLASTRKQSSGTVMSGNGSGRYTCYATIYLDGVLTYRYDPDPAAAKKPGMGSLPPDMNGLSVSDYAMVEFYAGGSTYPPWISNTNNDCGVLLLWSRER